MEGQLTVFQVHRVEAIGVTKHRQPAMASRRLRPPQTQYGDQGVEAGGSGVRGGSEVSEEGALLLVERRGHRRRQPSHAIDNLCPDVHQTGRQQVTLSLDNSS